MDAINCTCGATYTPKDIYAKNKHEASAKHRKGAPPVEETFADLDDETSGYTPAPETLMTPKDAKRTAKTKTPKGDHKVCRVCGEDKPLDEYRRKASRPDGKDTICAACSKAWLITHRAKKAAAK